MDYPYLATIIAFAGTFAPRGWAYCHGQEISISSNTALFSLLGTTYGGNGQTTFRLPDLRGRVMVGAGQGNGLPHYELGQAGVEKAAVNTDAAKPSVNHAYLAINYIIALQGMYPSRD